MYLKGFSISSYTQVPINMLEYILNDNILTK